MTNPYLLSVRRHSVKAQRGWHLITNSFQEWIRKCTRSLKKFLKNSWVVEDCCGLSWIHMIVYKYRIHRNSVKRIQVQNGVANWWAKCFVNEMACLVQCVPTSWKPLSMKTIQMFMISFSNALWKNTPKIRCQKKCQKWDLWVSQNR